MRAVVQIAQDTLDRLHEASGLPAQAWRELVQQSSEGPQSTQVVQIPEVALIRVADALELCPEQILEGKVDYRALAAHRQGGVTRLPEVYAQAASSRIRTSAHLFDWVENRFGWRARVSLLRKHQLTEALLGEPDMRINIRFLSEVCDEMGKMGVPEEMFLQIGARSLVKNYHTALGEEFRSMRTVRELYEKCFTEIIRTRFDENFRYRLASLGDEGCVVEAESEASVCEALQEKRLGSRLTCMNKAGGFASLPGYLSLPFASVRETACVHRGDEICRFEIDYSRASRAENLRRDAAVFH